MADYAWRARACLGQHLAFGVCTRKKAVLDFEKKKKEALRNKKKREDKED